MNERKERTGQHIFSTREAADYLGLTPQTVRWHVRVKGDLAPDKRIGGRFLVFARETLDAFREGHKSDSPAPALYSTEEAAERLGITVSGLKYHLYEGDLEPDRKVAGRLVFSEKTLVDFERGRR